MPLRGTGPPLRCTGRPARGIARPLRCTGRPLRFMGRLLRRETAAPRPVAAGVPAAPRPVRAPGRREYGAPAKETPGQQAGKVEILISRAAQRQTCLPSRALHTTGELTRRPRGSEPVNSSDISWSVHRPNHPNKRRPKCRAPRAPFSKEGKLVGRGAWPRSGRLDRTVHDGCVARASCPCHAFSDARSRRPWHTSRSSFRPLSAS
jgi:hypothetical protein